MKKHYILYETTNNINGMKYRGIHSTDNLQDGYLGSGRLLEQAIREYGRKNFSRIILEEVSSLQELLEAEKRLVDREWVLREDTYNIISGGGKRPEKSEIWNREKQQQATQKIKEEEQKYEEEIITPVWEAIRNIERLRQEIQYAEGAEIDRLKIEFREAVEFRRQIAQ